MKFGAPEKLEDLSAHQRMSTDRVFIRFAGYEQDPTNLARLDAWAERLKSLIEQGAHEVYFFCKQEGETYAPLQAAYLIGKLNETAGLGLRSPYDQI